MKKYDPEDERSPFCNNGEHLSSMPLAEGIPNPLQTVLELNGDSPCKTYLIQCPKKKKAAIIDPLKPRVANYLGLLAYHGLTLDYVLETHTHADHITASFELSRLTGARMVMHKQAPAPLVEVHVEEGSQLHIGNVEARIIYTPGHTPDSITVHLPAQKVVFPGDLIHIGGTGRTEFAGGDAGQSYDSIQKIMQLSDETVIYPAHDYRGNVSSTVGVERKTNPRFAGKSRDEYRHIMENLGLPLPEHIMESLQTNISAINDSTVSFPTISKLNEVRQLAVPEVKEAISAKHAPHQRPLLLDVRLHSEYERDGHIPGSICIPLNVLSKKYTELNKDHPIVCVCRAGVRSTTAAAMLTALGFKQVSNMKGGMLAWQSHEQEMTKHTRTTH